MLFCTIKYKGGADLLSHNLAIAVPSALEGLTAVFGMGTGVALPVKAPPYIINTNPKFEYRNPKQYLNPNNQNSKQI